MQRIITTLVLMFPLTLPPTPRSVTQQSLVHSSLLTVCTSSPHHDTCLAPPAFTNLTGLIRACGLFFAGGSIPPASPYQVHTSYRQSRASRQQIRASRHLF